MPALQTFRTALVLMALVSICLCLPQAAQAQKTHPAYKQVEEDPNLPRVLLIGDSISIGYTLPVRENLKGIANVQRPSTNCSHTTHGLKALDKWLGDKPWDVIHFNFGLHDLKYVDKNGKRVKNLDDGVQKTPIDQYEKNLEKIVQRMRKTGAILIWRTTTPVPEGALGRVHGDAAKYNEAALRVMKKYDVVVDDLYAFSLPQLDKIQHKADVHFTKEGSEILAKEVADKIKEQLRKKTN